MEQIMFVNQIWNFFSLLLTAVMLLASCGSTVDVEDIAEETRTTETLVFEVVEEATPTLNGTITIWHSLTEAETEGLSLAIEAFQERYPFVRVDKFFIPQDEIRSKFEISATNGGGPTLLIGSADWGPAFYDAALVGDIAPMVEPKSLQGFNQAALGSVRYKDALVGLPLSLNGVVLYRNRRIISKAPATVEALIVAAQKATSGEINGADLERGFFFSAAHLYAIGGQLMDENGNALFNNEKGAEWLNLLKSFSAAGLTEYYTDNDLSLFKQGVTGMIIDVTTNLNDIAPAIGEKNLSIDPWPVGLSGFVQSENIYLGSNARGNDKIATWVFMEYLVTPEIQAALAENDPYFIPAALGVKVQDRLRQQAIAALEGGVTFPVIPEMGAYWGPMDTALKSVFNDGTDPVTALQQAFESVIADIANIRGRN
jgi:arabinogalactan oligomer/maltooligosaccharide transport system substrate-binding protein